MLRPRPLPPLPPMGVGGPRGQGQVRVLPLAMLPQGVDPTAGGGATLVQVQVLALVLLLVLALALALVLVLVFGVEQVLVLEAAGVLLAVGAAVAPRRPRQPQRPPRRPPSPVSSKPPCLR
jgi:hypothetical protein